MAICIEGTEFRVINFDDFFKKNYFKLNNFSLYFVILLIN